MESLVHFSLKMPNDTGNIVDYKQMTEESLEPQRQEIHCHDYF